MYTSSNHAGERGFSLYECLIALSVMMILGGAVISLSQGALKVATTTYELSDAQSGVRAAQEYINRDLMNAGDGLNSMNNIKIRSGFVTNYLSKNNSIDYNNFGILTSDNDVPINTTVLGTTPSLSVRSSPSLTDRITVLANDSTFITYTPQSSNNLGDFITIASTDVGLFTAGEVYYITAAGGSTFGQITSISGTGLTRQLNFANGDTLGLNLVRTSAVAAPCTGQISCITNGGVNPVSMLRMQMIHYYVNSNGLLMRRVFGVKGAGFSESMIAEHIVGIQFRYILDLVDSSGNVAQPTRLLTSTQQTATRQVEVTVTAETPHSVNINQTTGTLQQSNGHVQTSMTTSTSVRNMQFKQALQPLAGG